MTVRERKSVINIGVGTAGLVVITGVAVIWDLVVDGEDGVLASVEVVLLGVLVVVESVFRTVVVLVTVLEEMTWFVDGTVRLLILFDDARMGEEVVAVF